MVAEVCITIMPRALFHLALGFGAALGFTLVLHDELITNTRRQQALLDLVEKDIRGEVTMRSDTPSDKTIGEMVREAYSRKWLETVLEADKNR